VTKPMNTERLHHVPPGLIAVVAAGALALLVHAFLSSNSERTAFVQPVSLVPPALPPQPPPPAPEKQEPEKELPQQPLTLDTNDLSVGVTGSPGPGTDASPSSGALATGPLGINEAGEGGSDAFGLAARSGGRELLFTRSGGGGNPSARYVEFANQLQSHIKEQLNQYTDLRKDCYTARVDIRIAGSGFIETAKIRSSTGDAALDAELRAALLKLAPLNAGPPPDMPQPVGLKIVSRRADCGP